MKRNDKFILRTIEDKHVLTASEGAKLPGRITMTESAALIWNLLSTERTVDQLVGAITGEYDVSPEVAEQDIRALLNQMRRLELLCVS